MKTPRTMLFAALLALSATAIAQGEPDGPGGPGLQPGGPGGPPGQPARADPVHRKLYPPELIMRNQAELRIDDKQRAAILKELEKSQPAIQQAQWSLQAASQELARLLSENTIDEAKALAQSDKVLELERTVKRNHLAMLIRIRNVLTPGQRAKLDELRETRRDAIREQRKVGPRQPRR